MSEQECGYFLLSSTANEMWKRGDEEGLGRMLACVSKVHKETFFRRVVYKSRLVGYMMLRELAESVFLQTWEGFNQRGKEGRLRLEGREYAAYLFTAFKGNYLKALEKELRRVEAEREFGSGGLEKGGQMERGDGEWSERTRRVLSKMSPECRELLIWKHIRGLSHDEIARKRNINRSSSIKMLSRCGRRFAEIWGEPGHLKK